MILNLKIYGPVFLCINLSEIQSKVLALKGKNPIDDQINVT